MSPGEIAKRLLRQPAREWPWMVEALACLLWARFLIRFVPFRLWRGWMGPIGSGGSPLSLDAPDRATALRVQHWVRRIAANASLPASCLPKAMAARWMLARRGIATELHIGARPGEQKPINLHAWLLCGNLCLTGAAERKKFAAFKAPEPGAAVGKPGL